MHLLILRCPLWWWTRSSRMRHMIIYDARISAKCWWSRAVLQSSTPFPVLHLCPWCWNQRSPVSAAQRTYGYVLHPSLLFLMPFVTFYLRYCYSCAPTQPPTSFFISMPHAHIYIVGMRTVKSWWRVGELWFVISLHVKTFIRGRTHHLHTLIIMTRGPGDECVCAWEREGKSVCCLYFNLIDADGIMSPTAYICFWYLKKLFDG